MFKHLIIISLTILISGCAFNQGQKYSFNEKKECLINNKLAPDWICQEKTENIGSFLTIKEITKVVNNDFYKARLNSKRNASLKLKNKIENIINEKVNSFLEKEKIDFVNKDLVIKRIYSNVKLNISQVGYWDNNEELFFLYGVNERSLNREIKHSLMYYIKKENKAFYDSKKIESKLDSTLLDI